MTGRSSSPCHYPARWRRAPMLALSALVLLLSGCASNPSKVKAGNESEPLALSSERVSAPQPLDLRTDDLLMHALGLIGTRYRFGGTNPRTGFDCSGFTSWVFREASGIGLPRTARDQFADAGSPVPREALVAGDLVFFQQSGRRIDHVGIYVGEGRFIHAPSRGGRVRIDALALPHWQRSYEGARRVLGQRAN